MKASEAIRIINGITGLYRNADRKRKKETAEAVVTIISQIKEQVTDPIEKKALNDYLKLPSVNADIERINYDADLRQQTPPAPLGKKPEKL
ncbi:hypothetical protein [Massilia brevitalea]|uniref:hypothetical protein n=1 Tax=Massilia brevitalea TaxID=442526 RepID=UPI002738DCAC|nr:hypothetical protein [Massilia brevitalea]